MRPEKSRLIFSIGNRETGCERTFGFLLAELEEIYGRMGLYFILGEMDSDNERAAEGVRLMLMIDFFSGSRK